MTVSVEINVTNRIKLELFFERNEIEPSSLRNYSLHEQWHLIFAHLEMIVPKVENRPITSNGLAGFRPATTQHGRITKDRLYWLGEIKRRSRMIQA